MVKFLTIFITKSQTGTNHANKCYFLRKLNIQHVLKVATTSFNIALEFFLFNSKSIFSLQ